MANQPNYPPPPHQPGAPQMPQPQRRKRAPRAWLWVLVALAAAAWLLNQLEPVFSIEDLEELLHVRSERFRCFVVLGIVLVAICAAARLTRSKERR